MSTMQKVSSRWLVLSPSAQAAYGGVIADGSLTVAQRFDPTSVFEVKPSNRTDKAMSGKGSEWATDDQITAWDTMGTIKSDGDAFLLGWMLAFTFGVDVATGAGPYTHTYALPAITANMPCTTVFVLETAAVARKFQDMSAKTLSITVPERGAITASLDMVGTGRWTPYNAGALLTPSGLLQTALYLLGSDVVVNITPTGGADVAFNGRQKGLSIKVDRATAPFQSSGDGLFASSNVSGDSKFSVDLTIAAEATEDVNTWFEAGTRCAVTIATNPGLPYQFGFTFPSVRIKANKLGASGTVVTWALSWDETTSIVNGGQAAMSAFVINNTPLYLAPV